MIIGICGFQGAGKDTLASILVDKFNFTKLSFASLLKDIVAKLFDWNRDKLDGLNDNDRQWRETKDEWWSNKLKQHITPRLMLQHIGTNLFRNNFNDDFWTITIEKQLNKYKNIVVTDCRFNNEIQMIKNNNGIIIHIFKNKPIWFDDFKNNKINVALHESEKDWIKAKHDFEIHNDSDIPSLEDKIKNIIHDIHDLNH